MDTGNAKAGRTDAARRNERDPIDIIMADPTLSDGQRVVMYWLWSLAGRTPKIILTNKHELAASCRRDPRTIEGNLKRLQKSGWIEIPDWDDNRGAIQIVVYRPPPGHLEPKSDPQHRLFDPTPGATSPEVSTPASAGSGPPSDHRTLERSAQALQANRAQNVPSQNPENHQPQGVMDSGLERFAQNVPSPQCVQREEDLCTSKLQRRSNALNNVGPGGAVRAVGREPMAIGAILPDALDESLARFEAAAQPAAQKARLKKRILQAAGVADAEWWVAGSAADLVITHGYPAEKLLALLDQVARRRGLPMHDSNRIRNPGGWLQTELGKLARQYEMQWGAKKTVVPLEAR